MWQARKVVRPTGHQGIGPVVATGGESRRSLRQRIFEHIRATGMIARVQLAKDLGISPASVTALTAELLDAGLIIEMEAMRDAEQGRGRPAVMLGVQASSIRVAGMKLSEREHTAVITDFAGNVLSEAVIRRPPGPAMSLSEILEAAETLLDTCCQRGGLRRGSLSAMGLGVPGFVDMASGEVHWSSIIDGRNIPLADAATARLGLPVTIDNDANLVTLAELWFGAGRDISEFAVVTIEHGLGMGYVLNHRLYRGGRGIGMELGHIKIHLDGALCRCGQRGCLEAYVADYALVREALTALNWGHREGVTAQTILDHLHRQAELADGPARSIFQRAGRFLAAGLSNVINLMDPPLIILSGERMRYEYLYAAETLAEMSKFTISTGRPLPPVEIHAWGDLLWAHGAAALALSVVTDQQLAASSAAKSVSG